MDMTNQDYGKLVNQYSQSSPLGKNMVWAFLVGGAICTAGQGLSNLYQNWGMDQDVAGGAVSITLILAAALLTGLGWFDKLAKRAGAGTLVPITGFANAMVSPALEFKSEGLITGTAAKLFVVAGPVLVFGIGALRTDLVHLPRIISADAVPIEGRRLLCAQKKFLTVREENSL